MCGIAGQFGTTSASFSETALGALRHRGPDGSGTWKSGKTTLVHTRLAILDLSDAGRQPMTWESRTASVSQPPSPAQIYAIVFNGEIYNYRDLRDELEHKGEIFASGSDTEVLLRLLVHEGAACLPKLAGMFAFAFWDESSSSALLARDALGIKPLYYREQGGGLSFSSEAHVLSNENDRTDATALRDFFLWGSVPEPATLNEAVRQVPAGHFLEWKDGGSVLTKWHRSSWWGDERNRNGILGCKLGGDGSREGQKSKSGRSPDLNSPAALTRLELRASVQRHLVSDVPVGIFLSGGIDSTVILALTRELLGPTADIRTFSIGFDILALDESGLARRTADHFQTRHTEWSVTEEEGVAEIPAYLDAVDQPTIDGFNTWCVSKLVRREGVKVALSGLGGDEIFAGYSSFSSVPLFQQAFHGLGPFRPAAAWVLAHWDPGSPMRRMREFLLGNGTWLEAYHAQRGIFTATEADAMSFAMTGRKASPPDWDAGKMPDKAREIVSYLELTRYLRNQLLRDSDVFSMAHGLELRVPFVDATLLDSLQSIPARVRLRPGKQLLVEAIPELPDWIKNQPKKGFYFPFQDWLKQGFGSLLSEAQDVSPVPLRTWYRTWAVTAATRALRPM